MATDYESTVAMEVDKAVNTEAAEEDSQDAKKQDDCKSEDDDVAPAENEVDDNNVNSEEVDDDDMSTTSSDDSDKDFSPKQDPEVLIIKGTTLKEEGNNFFKENDFDKAARSYRRGVNAVKPLNKQNTGDAQVQALLISLQTNLSMVFFKQGKFKQSLQVAGSALKVDQSNVKARYRRAVAHRKLGNLEEARVDLKEALKIDNSNATVRKELAAIKKQIEDAKAQQKKGLAKAFSRGSSSLYDDKEEAKRRKEEEIKEQKKLQEEDLKKRKVLWEDECVKRLARGDPALSFEEWDTERLAKEKEEKEKKKEEEKRRSEERRRARQAAMKDESDSDDEELTEKELAQLRGYKKTADGRVTSYFTREQTQAEKSLIGNIAPKRLEPTSTAGEGPAQISPTSSGEGAGKGRPSAWNQSGTTWEEKDTTDWCRTRLTSRLRETKVEGGPAVASVTSVENMTGEASVAIAGGKKRYIFDIHCKITFDVVDPDDNEVLATGTLNLPDICSTHHDELEVSFTGWKKSPSSDREAVVLDCRLALCTEVRESVKLWVADFNEMY